MPDVTVLLLWILIAFSAFGPWEMVFCKKAAYFQVFNSSLELFADTGSCCNSVLQDNAFVGARLDKEHRHCIPLEVSWLNFTEFEDGYAYYIKQKVSENSLTPGQSLSYRVPGVFTSGATLYLSVTRAMDSTWLSISFSDTVEGASSGKLVLLAATYISKLAFNQFDRGVWESGDDVDMTVDTAVPHHYTFTSLEDGIEMDLDGQIVYKSSRVEKYPPDTTRIVHIYSDKNLTIAEITFSGVPLE